MPSVAPRARGVSLLACTALLVSLLASCDSGSRRLAGTYTRSLYGEGDIQMTLASNGGLRLSLPSPRWPDSLDLDGKVTVKGDTLYFGKDSGILSCKEKEARYLVSQSDAGMTISRLGDADPCGARHAALVGTWNKS